MLGSDLQPAQSCSDTPVAQIFSLAEYRRGRQEQAAQDVAQFRVGDLVISRVDLAQGLAETGIIAALPRVPHGRAIVQFQGSRRALYLSQLARPGDDIPVALAAAVPVVHPCDVEPGGQPA